MNESGLLSATIEDDGAPVDQGRIQRLFNDPTLSPGTGLAMVKEFVRDFSPPARKGNSNITSFTIE